MLCRRRPQAGSPRQCGIEVVSTESPWRCGLSVLSPDVGGRFPVLEAFGNNAERKSLDAGHHFITILPVAQHAGQGGNLGDPATVIFAFELDREGHARNVPSRPAIHQLSRSWSRPATQTCQTTQRDMHLSPTATEDAVRLFDGRQSGVVLAENSGDILDTREEAELSNYVRLRAKALRRDSFRVITGARKLERATGIEPV
jgi:hypothetical protein